MAPDSPSDGPPEDELAELEHEKEEQVLHREPFEEELMEEGRSDIGTEFDDIEDEDVEDVE